MYELSNHELLDIQGGGFIGNPWTGEGLVNLWHFADTLTEYALPTIMIGLTLGCSVGFIYLDWCLSKHAKAI